MEKYIFYILSLSCASAFIEDKNNNRVEALTNCVVKFVEEWKCKNYNNPHLHLTVININNDFDLGALHNLKGIQFISRNINYNNNTLPNVAYIVISEDFEDLRNAFTEGATDSYWHPWVPFIIVVQNTNNNITRILKLLHDYNIFDVTLITYINKEYAIYKYNVTANVSCVESQHLVFASWCSEYRDNNSLPALVQKININGCRYDFITHNLWPFINIENNSNLEGIEQRMLKVFEKYTGVKVDLTLQNKRDPEGKPWQDIRGIMRGKVLTNEFEGAIGGHGLLFWGSVPYWGNLSYTTPVIINKLVYIIPQAIPLRPWEAVLNRCLYSFLFTVALFIIFCGSAMLLDIFPLRTKTVTRDIILVFGWMLSNIYGNISTRLPQRLIITCLLIFALIMPYVLQAFLSSVMTSPVQGFEPKEIYELKENNYKLKVYLEFPYKQVEEYEGECGTRLQCLLYMKNSKGKALYTIMGNDYYLVIRPKLADEECNLGVYRLRDPYVLNLRIIFVRRGSILFRPFKKFLFGIMSGELLDKYIDDVNYEHGLKCKYIYEMKKTPLSIADFNGAYLTLIVGIAISLLVFICEIYLHRYIYPAK